MAGAFPPVAELLPHRGHAVMLDAVLEHSENHTVARVCITRTHPLFLAGHGVPVWAGIEFMAQAAAAHAGLNNRRSGDAPRIGMLLGTRRYQAHTDYFVENMQLEVRAEREFGASQGVSACRCRISHNEQILASATLIVVESTEAWAP